MTKDKERDDALIEKKRLAGLFEDRTCYIPAEDYLRAATFLRDEQPKPVDDEAIPMLLHCPLCSLKHIDEGLFATKPHHTHACQGCGHVWRPAKVNTCGVQFLPGYKNAERGDEQPKPDRAEVLVHELWIMDSGPSQSVWLEVVRRHFTELRAEWEAERQDEPVCLIGKVDCDGNELVTVSKDALDRYKDQARYTYQRAEKAEARVKELEAERPAVVVPEDVRRVVWETARDALSKNWLPVYDFIKSLDGAKGGE